MTSPGRRTARAPTSTDARTDGCENHDAVIGARTVTSPDASRAAPVPTNSGRAPTVASNAIRVVTRRAVALSTVTDSTVTPSPASIGGGDDGDHRVPAPTIANVATSSRQTSVGETETIAGGATGAPPPPPQPTPAGDDTSRSRASRRACIEPPRTRSRTRAATDVDATAGRCPRGRRRGGPPPPRWRRPSPASAVPRSR